jgi:uncharacterized protein YxjI
MGTTDETYEISGLDLSEEDYTVEQSLIRNKYRAEDAAGNTVLRGAQKLFKMKEEFPFSGPEGETVFTVKAGGIVDVAGNYLLREAQDDEPLVVLDNDFSVLQDTWTIRDADTENTLAEINSRGALTTMARNFLPFGELIPHRYTITDQRGDTVGQIDGQFSLRDRYEVHLDADADVPREPVLAAAMVIDAIQGN